MKLLFTIPTILPAEGRPLVRVSQQNQIVEDYYLKHCGLSPVKCWAAASEDVSGVPKSVFQTIIHAKEDYQQVNPPIYWFFCRCTAVLCIMYNSVYKMYKYRYTVKYLHINIPEYI